MAENRSDLSNTMEIDAILEEARSRSGRRQDETVVFRPARAASEPVRSARTAAEADDSFVFVDEDGSYGDSRADRGKSAENKKTKKPLIVAIVIICVLLLAAGGGLTWYLTSGSSNFADNVTVSGVSLAGMNTQEAKAALAPVEQKLADEIAIEITSGDKKFTLTKNDLKCSFDTDSILADAAEYSAQKGIKSGDKSYDIKMTVDTAGLKTAVESIASQINAEPVDARVETFNADKQDMFTYADEKPGVKLRNDELIKSIGDMIASGKLKGSVEAPCDSVDAKVTADFLKSNIKKLSSFTTTSTNNSNGNENMRVSLSACNSSIIEPGETWSFNGCTGNSNLESNGYKPAGVLVQGRHEIGIGGGICQSSTTIYNAGLLCGLDIVERYCHYYKSAYVDAGRDATIDYGNLDLKLGNPYDYQVFLKCYMDGVVLHAEFYGVQPEEFDDIKITTSSPSFFNNGYKVAATREYYKDGKKVRSEELPLSTYYTSAPNSGNSNTKPTTASNTTPATSAPETPDPEPVEPDPEPVTPDPEPVTPDPEPVTPDPEPAAPDPVETPAE